MKLRRSLLYYIFIGVFALTLSNCDEVLETKDLGDVDLSAVVYNPLSEDEGIYPDKSVLVNPDNPFIKAGLTDALKWDINQNATTPTSISDGAEYFLWSTRLALDPGGVNQHYTAQAIRAIEGNSSVRAKKGYESVMDNFYHDLTYSAGPPYIPHYIASDSCSMLNTHYYTETNILCP